MHFVPFGKYSHCHSLTCSHTLFPYVPWNALPSPSLSSPLSCSLVVAARSLDGLVACSSFDSHHCNNFFYKNGVKEERTKKARNKKIWKKKILPKFHSIGSSFFLPFELDRRARERDSVFSMNWCFVVGTETEEERESERK